jgi:hypothetical protein
MSNPTPTPTQYVTREKETGNPRDRVGKASVELLSMQCHARHRSLHPEGGREFSAAAGPPHLPLRIIN